MTDFALRLNDNHQPQATLARANNLLNAVLLSLHIKRGSFFLNPNFGSRLHEIKTTSESDVALARQCVEESLAWMIAIKMVNKIDVSITPDTRRRDRLNISVTLGVRGGHIDVNDTTREITIEVTMYIGAAAVNSANSVILPEPPPPWIDVYASVHVGAGAIGIVSAIIGTEPPRVVFESDFEGATYIVEIFSGEDGSPVDATVFVSSYEGVVYVVEEYIDDQSDNTGVPPTPVDVVVFVSRYEGVVYVVEDWNETEITAGATAYVGAAISGAAMILIPA